MKVVLHYYNCLLKINCLVENLKYDDSNNIMDYKLLKRFVKVKKKDLKLNFCIIVLNKIQKVLCMNENKLI